jgi:hypothetical protein
LKFDLAGSGFGTYFFPIALGSQRGQAMAGYYSSFQILFPAPYRLEFHRLRQQLEEAHFAWKTEWKRQQLDFEIENIRFVHDPYWNKRFFSVQSARDGGNWFWRATKSLVTFEALSI